MSSFRDQEMLQQSFGNLSDTLLRNRMMKQEQLRQEQEQQRLQQQADATNAYRTKKLASDDQNKQIEQSLLADKLRETTRHDQATEQTQAAKGATGFSWKGVDGVTYKANSPQEFSQLIQQHPAADENGKHFLDMSGTDANGVTVHMRTEVPSNGGDSAKDSAKNIVSQFVQFSGAVPNPKPESQVGKQEVRQVLNPAHVVDGEVDTNQPAFLSLTNTTTPTAESPAPAPSTKKTLNADMAKQFLQQAAGDKDKARQMATQAGYAF